MKINLDGKYKEIKHLIDAPIKPDVKAPTEHSFDKILASISPRKDEILNKIHGLVNELTGAKTEQPNPNEMMARLQLQTPDPILPNPLPLPIVSDIETASSDVKTPTLLAARRITQDAYTVLRKPERVAAVSNLAEKFGQEFGIDPLLSMSIIENESAFDTRAVSKDGHFSKGLMQLLDSTGSQYHRQVGINESYDPFDPEQNVKLGVSYLRYLHDIFSTPTSLPKDLNTFAAANSSSLEKLAVAAYNAGEGRVASAQDRAKRAGADPSLYEAIAQYLPESTQKYVERVSRSKAKLVSERSAIR